MRDSELHLNLSEDEEGFDIPVKFYKKNDLVLSLEDWMYLFDTISYWNTKEFPSSLIMFALENYIAVGKLIKQVEETTEQPIFYDFKRQLYPFLFDKLKKDLRQEWGMIQFNSVLRSPNKPWNYRELSLNSNITWEIVEAHPEKPWDYQGLSQNYNITWEIIEAHPEKPWDYFWVSGNPNITWEIIQAHPEVPWDYLQLSHHPNITWEIVEAHPEKPWDYFWVSRNPNITWEIVQAHPEKP